MVRLLLVEKGVQPRDRLAQRGTWPALLVCLLFAAACTDGGPHPEPPSPVINAGTGGMSQDAGARPDNEGPGAAGGGGHAGGASGSGSSAGSGGATPGTAGSGGGMDADPDCDIDADAGECDEDGGALR